LSAFVTISKKLEILNEDKARVRHHRLERNDELRMEKSAKEMLHIQRRPPQTLKNGMDKHPNLFLMALMKYSIYHIKLKLQNNTSEVRPQY
jgi:hypothetical protein